jgi:hypothetical protein
MRLSALLLVLVAYQFMTIELSAQDSGEASSPPANQDVPASAASCEACPETEALNRLRREVQSLEDLDKRNRLFIDKNPSDEGNKRKAISNLTIIAIKIETANNYIQAIFNKCPACRT